VLEATEALRAQELDVWPLIEPDFPTFSACEDLGCSVVRVMGAPIGSLKGFDPGWSDTLFRIAENKHVLLMLDGGVGAVGDAVSAVQRGFDAVLVNSCLFGPTRDPVATLREFRSAMASVSSGSR
jgi:thiazole synthase